MAPKAAIIPENSQPKPKKVKSSPSNEAEKEDPENDKDIIDSFMKNIVMKCVESLVEEAIEKDSVEELLIEHEDMDNAIDFNYQFGGCGKMYDNEETANKHIEKEHMEEQQCSKCITYEDEEKVLKQLL